jgi:hypothetical protein
VTMASERQIAANRRNALRSTGPRTAAGKERSSRNAYRHGLRTAFGVNAAADVEPIARELAGGEEGPIIMSWARTAAEAALDIERVRRVRAELFEEVNNAAAGPASLEQSARVDEAARRLVPQLNALMRYELRAASRRDKAIRAICTGWAGPISRNSRLGTTEFEAVERMWRTALKLRWPRCELSRNQYRAWRTPFDTIAAAWARATRLARTRLPHECELAPANPVEAAPAQSGTNEANEARHVESARTNPIRPAELNPHEASPSGQAQAILPERSQCCRTKTARHARGSLPERRARGLAAVAAPLAIARPLMTSRCNGNERSNQPRRNGDSRAPPQFHLNNRSTAFRVSAKALFHHDFIGCEAMLRVSTQRTSVLRKHPDLILDAPVARICCSAASKREATMPRPRNSATTYVSATQPKLLDSSVSVTFFSCSIQHAAYPAKAPCENHINAVWNLEVILAFLPRAGGRARGVRRMLRSGFFRRQAETCLRLAEQCSDQTTAEQLRLVAAEFFRKATEAENGWPRDPPPATAEGR